MLVMFEISGSLANSVASSPSATSRLATALAASRLRASRCRPPAATFAGGAAG